MRSVISKTGILWGNAGTLGCQNPPPNAPHRCRGGAPFIYLILNVVACNMLVSVPYVKGLYGSNTKKETLCQVSKPSELEGFVVFAHSFPFYVLHHSQHCAHITPLFLSLMVC